MARTTRPVSGSIDVATIDSLPESRCSRRRSAIGIEEQQRQPIHAHISVGSFSVVYAGTRWHTPLRHLKDDRSHSGNGSGSGHRSRELGASDAADGRSWSGLAAHQQPNWIAKLLGLEHQSPDAPWAMGAWHKAGPACRERLAFLQTFQTSARRVAGVGPKGCIAANPTAVITMSGRRSRQVPAKARPRERRRSASVQGIGRCTPITTEDRDNMLTLFNSFSRSRQLSRSPMNCSGNTRADPASLQLEFEPEARGSLASCQVLRED